MKQTAVEWLFLMLNNPNQNQEFANKLFLKAKEMEKQQIIDAYKSGINCISDADADFYYTINYKPFYPKK
jgi:hypothetical protein